MSYNKSKYQNELAERLDAEIADDDIGSVDELGNYRRYDKEGAILTVTANGFVWVNTFDGGELAEMWAAIEADYDQWDGGAVAPV